MKISDLSSQNAQMLYINQTDPSNQPEKTPSIQEAKENLPSNDRVDISVRSKEMHKIYEVLQMMPDVRAEKVAQYKKSIEDGKYRVSSDDLADKMLKDSLLELI
jgi:flagellar biosynthesis anti-sigma factor FlgM